jgi:hypothetical protein
MLLNTQRMKICPSSWRQFGFRYKSSVNNAFPSYRVLEERCAKSKNSLKQAITTIVAFDSQFQRYACDNKSVLIPFWKSQTAHSSFKKKTEKQNAVK